LTATTNAGGAGKFCQHHGRALSGHTVVVLGDNDDAGRKHVDTVMRELQTAGVKARELKLPGLPHKGDVLDWIAAGGTAEALADLVSRTKYSECKPKAEKDDAVDADAEIARLAALPTLKYGQQRAAAAKGLGISVAILDKVVAGERPDNRAELQGEALEFPDPAAWAHPVDGFELICDIRDLLHRDLVLPPGAGWAVAIWCLHTFLLGITEHTPRLAVTSPERGCGKTTLLDLLGRLVFRPLLAANLTAAATFRVIARHRPCLLIDEADTFLRDNEELRGVLNAGHRYNGFVLRTVGEDMEPRQFSVFAPVAIALIGNLPGTFSDRSIPVRMRRAGAGDIVEPIRKPTHVATAELVSKAHRWAENHRDRLTEAEAELPANMWNRVADNWRQLFAIAQPIGGVMPEKLTEAAEILLRKAMLTLNRWGSCCCTISARCSGPSANIATGCPRPTL
jgi:putative DNA primase/helicase